MHETKSRITVVGSRMRSKDLNGLIKDLLLNKYETEINNIHEIR